jgi:hypothetical protein
LERRYYIDSLTRKLCDHYRLLAVVEESILSEVGPPLSVLRETGSGSSEQSDAIGVDAVDTGAG